MLMKRNEKIEALWKLLYNEIKEQHHEMMKLEKNSRIEVAKDDLIELIKDMDFFLNHSLKCIEKNEIITDSHSEGYFFDKVIERSKKKKEEIEQAKQRKKDNEKL